MIVGLIISIIAILVDQITKMAAVEVLTPLPHGIDVISGFFKFELHYNTGAAWSMFDGNKGFLIGVTLIAIVIFAFLFRKINFRTMKFYSWGISLMSGGLFGNFIDRLVRQDVIKNGVKVQEAGVVDFLDFNIFGYPFPTFNIADMCLVIGVILFSIDILFFSHKREKIGESHE